MSTHEVSKASETHRGVTTIPVMTGSVIRLRGIELVVANLESAERFYRDCFGFEPVDRRAHSGERYSTLLGLENLRSSTTVVRLGSDELFLTCYEPPGNAYPRESTAADLRFQHIAVVVRDADAAHDRLRRDGRMTPISSNGPERLPPNTGCVTVFKFRDPEGHPIEISELPPGVGAPRWHEAAAGGNFLGIDHSAISVADASRSIGFYRDVLGMSVTFQSVNRGPEQDRLDGLHSEGVDVVALNASDEKSPHIELLAYHPPAPHGATPLTNDIAATKLFLQVDHLGDAVVRLQAAAVSFVSPGVVTLESGEELALVRDPDGHLLFLSEQARSA